MPRFKIQHVTRYTYEVPVRDSANQIMLYPISDDYQEVVFHKISVTGNPLIEHHMDVFLNRVGTFTHAHSHQELVIDSRLEVDTRPRKLPEDTLPVSAQWAELEKVGTKIPYIDFLRLERFQKQEEIQDIIDDVSARENSPLQTARDYCTYVFENFAYVKGITTVETTLDEIWKIKSGVCQDFAHFLLALLRRNQIPARYVSGYICPNQNGMRGEGATHAWVEAFIPTYGWLGFDPTNNCIVNENHVRLAVGKNFSDCSPVKGTYRGVAQHLLEVSVIVSYEDGHSTARSQEDPGLDATRNSFQKHQEMQQQQ